MQDERLQKVLERINDIHQGGIDWCPLLEQIGEYFRANFAAIIERDPDEGLVGFHAATSLGRGHYKSHVVDHTRHDLWMMQEKDCQQGEVYVGESIASQSQCAHRDDLDGAELEWSDLHHRLCAVLSRRGASSVCLEVMRPKAWPEFDQADVERCRTLLPLLQCLLRMQGRAAELKRQRDTMLHALDHLPWGVILIDRQRRPLTTNRVARDILLAGDGLVAHGNTVRAANPDETVRLGRLVREALSEAAEETLEASGAISITRQGREQPLSLRVMPIRLETETLGDRLQAAIFVSDPDVRSEADDKQLRELYSLTVSEARLAAQLSSGKSIDEAAATMGVKVNTARAYLKRIYNKTGVHRQSELVRILLLGLAGLS